MVDVYEFFEWGDECLFRNVVKSKNYCNTCRRLENERRTTFMECMDSGWELELCKTCVRRLVKLCERGYKGKPIQNNPLQLARIKEWSAWRGNKK